MRSAAFVPVARTPQSSTAFRSSYYGADTPLNQVASINVEDARTLLISPWDKKLLSGNREGDPEERPRHHAGSRMPTSIRHSVAAAVGREPARSGAAGKTGSGTGARRHSQHPSRCDQRRARPPQGEGDFGRRRASCGRGHPEADRQANSGNRSRFGGKRSRFIKDLTLESRR